MPLPYTNSYWPTNFQGCTITGTYVGLDGKPVTGSIVFNARPTALLDFDDLVTILPRAIQVTLDPNGSFSVVVPATDDPDISPQDWTYQVTQQFTGGRPSFDIEAPMNTTVDITTVSPLPDSTGNPIVRGPRGMASSVVSVQNTFPGDGGDVDLTGVTLLVENDLGDLQDPAAARAALGLGSAATHPASDFATSEQVEDRLVVENNLSDVANPATALRNLGGDALPQGYLGTHASSVPKLLSVTNTLYGPPQTSDVLVLTLAETRRVKITCQVSLTPVTYGQYYLHCAYQQGQALDGTNSTKLFPAMPVGVPAGGLSGGGVVVATVVLPAGTYAFAPVAARSSSPAGAANDSIDFFSTIVEDVGND